MAKKLNVKKKLNKQKRDQKARWKIFIETFSNSNPEYFMHQFFVICLIL